jgi:hypothetical protein
MIMEEVEIWEHVEKEIIAPSHMLKLAAHVKKEAKAK